MTQLKFLNNLYQLIRKFIFARIQRDLKRTSILFTSKIHILLYVIRNWAYRDYTVHFFILSRSKSLLEDCTSLFSEENTHRSRTPLHPRWVFFVRDIPCTAYKRSIPYAGLSSPKASWCRLAFSLKSAMLLFFERAAAAASDAARLNGWGGWWPADGAEDGGGGGGGGRQKRPPAAA